MSRAHANSDGQLGFDALLEQTDRDNVQAKRVREFAHLPGTMEEALPYYRRLIERHHAAMLADDAETYMAIRKEAHDLAYKLNNFDPGILADDDAPGEVLERLTAAEPGSIPIWGQSGSFAIEYQGIPISIEQDGMFGISASSVAMLGFSASAIDWDRPFISETGYWSFVGLSSIHSAGMTPDTLAKAVIDWRVLKENKGKLKAITRESRMSHLAWKMFEKFSAEHPDHEDDDESDGHGIRRAAFIAWLRHNPSLGKDRDDYLSYLEAEQVRKKAEGRKWAQHRHAHLMECIQSFFGHRHEGKMLGIYGRRETISNCVREVRALRAEYPDLKPRHTRIA